MRDNDFSLTWAVNIPVASSKVRGKVVRALVPLSSRINSLPEELMRRL